jgi:hypothetical protein
METIALLGLKKLDRQVLLDTYLQRPKSLMLLDFGTWFCYATAIKDETLKALNFSNGMLYVNNADYDALPHLHEKLLAYNTFHEV